MTDENERLEAWLNCLEMIGAMIPKHPNALELSIEIKNILVKYRGKICQE